MPRISNCDSSVSKVTWTFWYMDHSVLRWFLHGRLKNRCRTWPSHIWWITVNGKSLFLASHCFAGLVQRIFNRDRIHGINLTPDNVLNILMCGPSAHFCVSVIKYKIYKLLKAPRGAGHPLSSLSVYFPVFCSFLLFPFLVGFNYFLLLSVPFLSTRIVPLRFQVGGRRKRPNLYLFCVFCIP